MADIEVVIKMSQESYNNLKIGCTQRVSDGEMIEAIKNGTLLPKVHGRLKDENEIKQMIEDAKVENETSRNFAENIIKFASTVIEADTEVRDKE